VLQVVDTRWREHLENMDYMREGIGLRGLAQKDPLVEYRNEGHLMFQELNRAIREEVVTLLFHAEVSAQAETELQQASANGANGMSYEHQSLAGADAILAAGGGTSTAGAGFASSGGVATAPMSQAPKVNSEFENVGRNDLCPCGSGKKFKKCHGA
jgi:preprotein translocase subunit SecA